MEYILQVLSHLTNDPDSARVLFTAAVAGAIFVLGLGLMFLVLGISNPLRRRLGGVAGPRQRESTTQKVADTLQTLSPYILPKKESERSSVSANLIQAGFRSPNALTVLYGAKSFGAIFFPILVLLFVPLFFPGFSFNLIVGSVAGAGLAGLLLPSIVVERIKEKRQRAIMNGLPDAIDLLVVCTEAGLGLNAAFQRVADELIASHPQIADELALVNAELRAGVDRSLALKNLAKRTGLQDIKGLVAVLSQSMRFGTSVADSLRIYSEEFRDKRLQRAEEAAAKIATKMIFPLVFCFFPGFFVVAIGPGIVGVLDTFRGMGH